MSEWTKERLHSIVWIFAHNAGELTEEVIRYIDAFEPLTYRRLLTMQREKRLAADRSGAPGGGATTVAQFDEALDHLDHILAR